MTFSCGDLDELTQITIEAWRSGSDRDWSAPAGTLEWSCTRTADHTIDTLLAPALFLASRKTDDYPGFEPVTMGTEPTPATLIEGLAAATRVLTAVVAAAEPGAEAVIWRRPRVERRGPADFVPRGALELVLHAHDVCTGLGVAFNPPEHLCENLRQHTRTWPHWTSPGWTRLSMAADPWTDLLHSSGRRPRRNGTIVDRG